MFQGEQWKAARKEMTEQIYRANKTAAGIVNGERRVVFQQNANYTAYQIEKSTRGAVNFGLYDSGTVTRLLKEDRKLLPEYKVNQRKDYKWNNHKVNSAVTQSIIQGESIDDLSKRLTHSLEAGNRSSMLSFARTAMTGAQNAGRIEAMHDAEDMGIRVQKRWIATLDSRTRDTHAELDGQVVDVDEPFTVDGMEIMFPGDPSADPSLVYNCRCTLGYEYPGVATGIGQRRDNETGETVEWQSYREWELGKQEQARTLDLTEKSLNERGKSGIIELTEEQNRQRFTTTEELAQYFEWVDDYGEKRQMIDAESFKTLEMETQNRVANALDHMISKFDGARRPSKISVGGKFARNVYGVYDPRSRSIRLNPAMIKDKGQEYATAVHEMAHHYDNVLSGSSKKTVNEALHDLGFKRGSIKTDNLLMMLVGSKVESEWKDDAEVIARSMERNAVGKGTELSQAVEGAFLRRLK